MTGRIVLTGLLLLAGFPSLEGEVFRFKQRPGERYRILNEVKEKVYIDRLYSHSAEILNRISIEVLEREGDKVRLDADFLTSERTSGGGNSYTWSREYNSIFLRDHLGRYTIEPKYYMPVLRDLPVFPAENVPIGGEWNYPAREVHDLRDNLGVPIPYSFPVEVFYRYSGTLEQGGELLHRIEIRYTIYHRADAPAGYPGASPTYPIRISGVSEQELLWNNRLGRPHSSTEEFDIQFELLSGVTVEYRGSSTGRVVESVELDRGRIVKELQDSLGRSAPGDMEIKEDPRGVAITLRNILFEPDSALLRPEERRILREICKVLRTIPEFDLEIAGHTAHAGTPEGRMLLSEQRAQAVGDLMLAMGCRQPDQIVIRGFGSTRPVGDNTTERGRALNRRVEIIILEN